MMFNCFSAIRCPIPEVDKAYLSTNTSLELKKELTVTCKPGYMNTTTDKYPCLASRTFDIPRNICVGQYFVSFSLSPLSSL
jgi:hypothetical protein